MIRLVYFWRIIPLRMSGIDNQSWQKLWDDYTRSFENWKIMFESMQKAAAEMQENFNRVWTKASAESSPETMLSFGTNWQKAMEMMQNDFMTKFSENWQKAAAEATNESFQKFGSQWQHFFNDAGMKQMQAYGDAMKQFADTWNTMWPQKDDNK